ncbi:MAG: DUF3800 domain-containing protein [Spirochaetales bacterium]
MENIMFVDESKTDNGKIYIFTGIVFKNAFCFFDLNEKINLIKSNDKYSCISGELKGSQLKSTKTNNIYVELFTDYMDALVLNVQNGNVSFRFFFMKGNDFKIGDKDVEKCLNDTFESITSISSNDVQKYFYYQLSYFLVFYLDELPFHGDFLGKVISDNTFSLNKMAKQEISINETSKKLTTNAIKIVPSIIENMHNSIFPKSKHHGLNAIDFEDSQMIPLIQICDYFSNFMLSYINYKYLINCGKINDAKKYEYKYKILNKYIGLDGLDEFIAYLQSDNMGLYLDQKFIPYIGKLNTHAQQRLQHDNPA